MTEQAPGFYRRRVGDHLVTAINDGFIDIPLAALMRIDGDEASGMLMQKFRRASPRSSVNAYLVQGGGRTVLIDTGSGNGMGPTMGRLVANLESAGVRPGDVDLVLLTHLHPDHSGGLATPSGTAVFEQAELAVGEADARFWLDQDAANVPEGLRPYVLGAQASAAPYSSRLRRLKAESAAPGITPVPLPGHTPGHAGYRIGDGPDALLIWGDVMHVPDVQAPRPEVGVVFDIDPEQAVVTRRRVLEMVSSERLAVAGMHLHFPGFAHVVQEGAGYVVVPETWVHEV